MAYKVLLPNEEVKIVRGVFNGIYGYPEQIKMDSWASDKLESTIHIRVDNKNVVQVGLDDVEFLYDDYLLYKSDIESGKPVKVIGKYRIKKDNLDKVLMDKYNEIISCSQKYQYCISAIPMDKVEFNFNGLSISIDEINNIIK